LIANIEIGGPFRILAEQLWIKARNRQPHALGEMIIPTEARAGSSDTGTPPVNLTNGSGLRDFDFDDLAEHCGDPACMWRSAKADIKDWVEFDFVKPQTLIAISVWNYNDMRHTDRGVRKMDISVWTRETGWRKIHEDLQLDQAEGGDAYDEPTVVKLDPTTAQKVRFDNLVSFGDTEYVGLSEVQFFGPPEPKALKPSPDDGPEGVGLISIQPAVCAAGQDQTSSVRLESLRQEADYKTSEAILQAQNPRKPSLSR
jgi:hypothetical protein